MSLQLSNLHGDDIDIKHELEVQDKVLLIHTDNTLLMNLLDENIDKVDINNISKVQNTQSQLAISDYVQTISGENIEDIPNSIYWSIVTLTTVGYGNVFPVTIFGKIIFNFITG